MRAIRACLVGALLALPFAGVVPAGSVYKCRDEAGKVHYADRPCAGEQAQQVIEVAPSAGGTGTAARDGPGSMKRVLEAFRIQREALAEERGQRKAERERRRLELCERLKTYLDKLENRHCDASGICGVYSLVEKDESGGEVVLSEREKRAEIGVARAKFTEECG